MELGQTAGPCGPGKTEPGINQLSGGEREREGWWVGRWETDREAGKWSKSKKESQRQKRKESEVKL